MKELTFCERREHIGKPTKSVKGTHKLKSIEKETCEDKKRMRAQERHSLPGNRKERDL